MFTFSARDQCIHVYMYKHCKNVTRYKKCLSFLVRFMPTCPISVGKLKSEAMLSFFLPSPLFAKQQ